MTQRLLAAIIRLATGVRRQPEVTLPASPAIYFANHTSHLDFLSIWAALPPALRKLTHPVAAKDYWSKTRLRRWTAASVFQAHLISRQVSAREGNPLDPLSELLEQDHSLIIFPEGTRSRDGTPGKFKPGIHHLALRHPDIPLIPVHLENMNRILPAGELLPIPLLGQVEFRERLELREGESKADFLARAQHAVEHGLHDTEPPPAESP